MPGHIAAAHCMKQEPLPIRGGAMRRIWRAKASIPLAIRARFG